MTTVNAGKEQITIVTLGPDGTCHERAVRAYMGFQGVGEFEIEFIEDFFEGLEMIRGREDAFLVQCSAHPLVHKVTERYRDEVFVVLLAVPLGLVPATAGYIDEGDWEITEVVSKPVVARELLEGRYEAGLTHLEYAERYPEQLRVVEKIGEIDTTWVVYGTRKRFRGELIGIPSPELFRRGAIA